MEMIAIGVGVFLAVMVPCSILTVCLLYGRNGYGTSSYRGYERGGGSTVIFSLHPNWFLELADMQSGVRIWKQFRGHLIVGRDIGERETSGVLYVAPDRTVSRKQCRILSGQNCLYVENLSDVNITRINGFPVDTMQRLTLGDVLKMGNRQYMVTNLKNIA